MDIAKFTPNSMRLPNVNPKKFAWISNQKIASQIILKTRTSFINKPKTARFFSVLKTPNRLKNLDDKLATMMLSALYYCKKSSIIVLFQSFSICYFSYGEPVHGSVYLSMKVTINKGDRIVTREFFRVPNRDVFTVNSLL